MEPLALPRFAPVSHLLGVTDPGDSDHVAMLALAEATIRLADLARGTASAADAVNELWPLVARLEARAAEGHLEGDTLAVLGRAWTSLEICLGTVLPEERLTVAAKWTGKGVAAAEHLDDPQVLATALAMHGNELRKSSQMVHALTVLERATVTVAEIAHDAARRDRDAGVALAFLARAAAELGDGPRFTEAIATCYDLVERGVSGGLLDPFTCREIHPRGLLDIGDLTAAVALAETAPAVGAPAPAWDVIECITYADVLHATGDRDQAEQLLLLAVDLATRHRLPHQIQRIVRTAHRGTFTAPLEHASAALAAVCSRPVLRH